MMFSFYTLVEALWPAVGTFYQWYTLSEALFIWKLFIDAAQKKTVLGSETEEFATVQTIQNE